MLLFIPNILAYIRIILVSYMIYILPTNPILSFILTFISGLCDLVDGRMARLFKQTSKLGLVFDLSIDRITNLAQMFYLTRLFPKYCFIFFIVGFSEIIRDVIFWIGSYYEALVHVFEYLYSINTVLTLDSLKKEIYETGILNRKTRIYLKLNDNGVIIQDHIIPFIWYTSDVFYWFLYICAFYKLIDEKNQKKSLNFYIKTNKSKFNELNFDTITHLKSTDEKQSTSTETSSINCEFQSDDALLIEEQTDNHLPNTVPATHFETLNFAFIMDLFVDVGKRIEDFLKYKLNIKLPFISLQFIFYYVGIVLLCGAFLKFCLAVREIILVTFYIIKIDYRSVEYWAKYKP